MTVDGRERLNFSPLIHSSIASACIAFCVAVAGKKIALSVSVHKCLVCLLYAVNANDSNCICLMRKTEAEEEFS